MVSSLVTFSFRKKTPPKTIKIGAMAAITVPSKAVVLSKPKKTKDKQRGIPRKPMGTIGKILLRVSFSFLKKKIKRGIKITAVIKNRQKRKVKGGGKLK